MGIYKDEFAHHGYVKYSAFELLLLCLCITDHSRRIVSVGFD